jgi:hypothetical protein
VVVSDALWSSHGARRDPGISLVELVLAVTVIGSAAGIVTAVSGATSPVASAVCSADRQALRVALVGWRIDHPWATSVDQAALVTAGLLDAPSPHWSVGNDLEPVAVDPFCSER